MLFTQCVGLGWNTYLSYASSLPHPTRLEAQLERAVEGVEHALEGRKGLLGAAGAHSGERGEGLALEQIGI